MRSNHVKGICIQEYASKQCHQIADLCDLTPNYVSGVAVAIVGDDAQDE